MRTLHQILLCLAPCLLLTAIVLFIAGAGRGFEFTDESYYVLNYLYWRDLKANLTLFGMYMSMPFFLLGESIFAIRIFGLLLIVSGTLYFFHSLRNYCSALVQEASLIILVCEYSAAVSTGMLYYSYLTTLRAPSYNLLSLFGMLVSSGIVFSYLSRPPSASRPVLRLILYGVLLSMVATVKATTATCLAGIHLAALAASLGRHAPLHFKRIAPLVLIGACLNFACLTLANPDWIYQIVNGLELLADSHRRSPIIVLKTSISSLLSHTWTHATLYSSGLLLHVGVIFAARQKPNLLSVWIPLVSSCVFYLIASSLKSSIWLATIVIYCSLLWSTELVRNKPSPEGGLDPTLARVAIVNLTLCLAFPWGTNNPLLLQSKMSAVFPLSFAIILLSRLRALQIISPASFSLTLALFCLPTLCLQARSWTERSMVYRLPTNLSAQKEVITVGSVNTTLLVDPITQGDLQRFTNAMKTAGFSEGGGILDFTGDSPGLVYAARGRPLGVAWLIGGYPESSMNARKVLTLIGIEDAKRAWIITSTNNPRRIEGWEEILADISPIFLHEKVFSLDINSQYSFGKTPLKKKQIDIWRPKIPPSLDTSTDRVR